VEVEVVRGVNLGRLSNVVNVEGLHILRVPVRSIRGLLIILIL
jgi:hypothetical protein